MTSPTVPELTDSTDLPMLYFGATCKPIAEQLAGFDLGSLCVRHAQSDADAITWLYVRGYITQQVKDRALKRLMREIKRAIKEPPHAD